MTNLKTMCGGCSLYCDDAIIEVSKGEVKKHGFCETGLKWLSGRASIPSFPTPCRINGEHVETEEAIEFVGNLIANSHLPLVCGFQDRSNEMQIKAIKFARSIRAAIDWTECADARNRLRAIQRIGEVSCTLGEIKERCDKLFILQSDFEKTHPRFLDRFVDTDRTRVFNLADLLAKSDCHTNGLALTKLLHRLLQGLLGVEEKGSTESDISKIEAIENEIRTSHYSVFLIGKEVESSTESLELLLQLVRNVNDFALARTVRLSNSNENGSMAAMLAFTGAPFAATADVPPRFRAHDFQAQNLLQHQQCDLSFHFGGKYEKAGKGIRQVVFSSPEQFASTIGDVQILVADPPGGTVVRTDGLPVKTGFPANSETNALSTEWIVEELTCRSNL